jgi:phosphatidylglycerol---prolipoprotein diacylglyceryl transferase
MPPRFYSFGSFTLSSYTLLLTLAALAVLATAIYRLRGALKAGDIADACLGALVGGAVGARLGHILLNWDYFAEHIRQIPQLHEGGLDWHGAVLGGLLGLLLVARWRKLDVSALLDALTPAPPLLALAGWTACLAWACGYGREVDTLARYPAFSVSEAADVYGIVAPRYNTQQFGILISLVVLATALFMLAAPCLRGVRFWRTLALLGAGMFVLGFWRADPVGIFAGLRLDQWLDLVITFLGILAFSFQRSAISQEKKLKAES